MKKLMNRLSALAIAVALAMANTSCSSDDDNNDMDMPPAAPAPNAYIAVEASLNVEYEIEETRSDVVEVEDGKKKKRQLKFTEGDQLYFSGKIKSEYTGGDKFRMVGLLTLVSGSITDDGKKASFEGNLTFYKQGSDQWEWNKTTEYSLHNPNDPMLDLDRDPKAYLIPNGCAVGTGCYQLFADKSINFKFQYSLSADVATLMASGIEVSGYYDSDAKCFELGKNGLPIFNCAISGLLPNTTYYVGVCPEDNLNDYNDEWLCPKYDYYTPVTADGEGKVSFAIFVPNIGEKYWALWFADDGDFMRSEVDYSVYLGKREVEGKVYNITETAEDGAPEKSE